VKAKLGIIVDIFYISWSLRLFKLFKLALPLLARAVKFEKGCSSPGLFKNYFS